MKLHTDILSADDLRSALPRGVLAHITPKGSRSRARAFDVTLYVLAKDDLHRRFGNSGGYGANDDVAATWDEWGIWMAKVYEADPNMVIGWYKSFHDFIEQTKRHRDYIRMAWKPHTLEYRTHLAPWLDKVSV